MRDISSHQSSFTTSEPAALAGTGTQNDSAPGLSEVEARARQRRDGPNTLPHPDRRRWPQIVGDVLREPMLLLLIAASSLYLLLGDARDAALLGFSVLLVAALTLYQEARSERALQALRDLSSPRAHVRRDGTVRMIAAADVVIGDHLLIAEGDRVPADAELISGDAVELDESLLTGESAPVQRSAMASESLERRVFAGTLVVRGHAVAEVVAIGVATEMGRIGVSLQQAKAEKTPLQREMRRVVAWFALIALLTCTLVVAIHVALRGDWLQALLAGITLAMANIPEEFPVVLTVFLALGGWRMARRRVLVRRPATIEALGSVTVLCTDKTGTLTENKMAVAEIVADRQAPVSVAEACHPESSSLLRCAALASEAQGYDPMDRAILDADAALPRSHSDESNKVSTASRCLRTYPLGGDLLAYTKVWREPERTLLLIACKGAPEAVADLCSLSDEPRAEAMRVVAAMAGRGLRVLAVAEAQWPAENAERLPIDARGFDFRWLGLLGLADPLRSAVPAAVAEAQAAGVRVIMLTGDHLDTARAIATAAGLSQRVGVALGEELAAMDADAYADAIRRIDVFARVRPEHKLALVNALKSAGEVVAMTGDGVNDAPALSAAHVAIAMGGRGTDVAREASSIVLLDDNFVSIVRAIEMGRTIYNNIRRAARYIIAVHVPITGLALLPLLLGTPLILLPLHVVFLELIIDPACSIALEREPAAPDVMRRPPRAPNTRLIGLRDFAAAVARGLIAFAAVVVVYLQAIAYGLHAPQQAALAFSALVAGNLALLALHRSGQSLRVMLSGPNPAFWSVTLPTLALVLAIALWPLPGRWFGFEPPPWPWLAWALVLPVLALLAAETLVLRPLARRRNRIDANASEYAG